MNHGYKKSLLLMIINYFMVSLHCYAIPEHAQSKDFVYLDQIDPTILVSLRYDPDENFVGTAVDGYKKSVVILTKKAAEALKNVQEELVRMATV